ncbi:Methyltransferase domain-containing protein [Virgibacillus subterraneus]|uniref:Methyltransferase domain-containing protein n=3 Tax=Bacillaceae TaxID=186817 RepID=A0A1H0XXY8_9BACI|nr:Methyltransferase domain-containing protein [Virgibacillus salinus]SEP63232.1 Methyltransferase domain-containing protein [Virgibacillus subterraneus]
MMLKDTGERVIPEKMKITNELLIEHVARYHFASDFVHGRVLDFASGAGYGTHIIAKKCKDKVSEVVGVDIDTEAVKYAQGTFYHPLSTFIEGDVTDSTVPDKLGQFDCVLSFETIEHVEEESQFLANIYEMLRPGGTLILSTPFGEGRGVACGSPFHIHQLRIDEFRNLFPEYTTKEFYFQKGALIKPADFEAAEKLPLGLVICRK